MSEATFKQHLSELETVLGNLKGHIETGAVNKINDWYDQVLDVILNFEDTTEDVIDARNGYDAESLEDEDVVESTESITDDSEEEEIEAQDLEYEDEDEEDVEDEEEISLETTSDSTKTITININLKP